MSTSVVAAAAAVVAVDDVADVVAAAYCGSVGLGD